MPLKVYIEALGGSFMKTRRDEAIEEVRTARKALCARFGNEPRRLLEYMRQRQRRYRGRVIRGWAEIGKASDPAGGAVGKTRSARQ